MSRATRTNPRTALRCFVVVVVLQHVSPPGAAEHRAAASPEDHAVDEATHPFLTNTLQVQPAYVDIRDGGNATQVLVRLGVVCHYLVLPGIKLADTYSFARLEIYGKSLNSLASPNVVGLQDWNALLLGVKPFGWGAQVGLGGAAVLPTATNPALDNQEFQLGPAIGAMVTRVTHLQIGALVRVLFSVAGAKPDLGYALVQPIIVYHLPKAFYLKTDGIMNFDFEGSPRTTVPVNLHFGHAFTAHLVISAIVEVVTTGSGVANVTAELNLNYVAWCAAAPAMHRSLATHGQKEGAMRSIGSSTAVALLLIVAGCGATIHSSVATNADLAKYKTFSFYTPPYKQGQAESIADQTIRSALEQDLSAKGLMKTTAANPDFLVAYHVKEQQKLDVDTVGYGFWGWGGPGAVTQYTQGTLIVDFIDPQTKQVFWRGTAADVVNHPASPNTAKIDKVVGQIVNKYPAVMAATPRTTM